MYLHMYVHIIIACISPDLRHSLMHLCGVAASLDSVDQCRRQHGEEVQLPSTERRFYAFLNKIEYA